MKTLSAVFVFLFVVPLQFAVAAEEAPLPAFVSQWAKSLNKSVEWQAGSQYDRQTIRFEAPFVVATVGDFGQALQGLNKIIQSKSPLAPLQACIYKDVVVIRRVDQRECSKPDIGTP